MRLPVRWPAALAVLVVACCVACSGSSGRAAPRPTPSPASTCPASYEPPDPHRPVVNLAFTVGADHARVVGTERVGFTPDAPVDRLVFRLWPNSIEQSAGSLTVSRVLVDGRTLGMQLASAGGRADTPGTLLTVPLGSRSPAGRRLAIQLDFVLLLPPAGPNRVGHTAGTAWWGSAHPLLAWVRGRGWVDEPGSAAGGETAVSEAADTQLTVTAPATDEVLATGRSDAPTSAGPGLRSWHFAAAAARDVAVAVGRFTTIDGALVGGQPLRVGAAADLAKPVSPGSLVNEASKAAAEHATRFGPYPYESLAIAALSGLDGVGIEYPGMVFVGPDSSPSVLTHEIAHQWFYGLVGNDQERDPWLDESFATMAELIVHRPDANTADKDAQARAALAMPGRVGDPISVYGADEARYFAVVYAKGGAALLVARAEAGPARFDAALRCYAAAYAWQVATPAELAQELHALPPALSVLRQAGALPQPAATRQPTSANSSPRRRIPSARSSSLSA